MQICEIQLLLAKYCLCVGEVFFKLIYMYLFCLTIYMYYLYIIVVMVIIVQCDNIAMMMLRLKRNVIVIMCIEK